MIYMAKRVEPNHDLVLVRRVDIKQTAGGIVIPEERNEESNLARIVAIGDGIPGKPETKPRCLPGEYWLVARFIGTVFAIDGVDHVMVKWADCQGRVIFSEEALQLLDEAMDEEANQKNN
jgi:co-chaperonin GroES (HSP10)